MVRDHEAVGSNPATRTRIEAVELLQFHGFFCFAAPEGAETDPPLSGRGADHQVTKGNTAMEENYFQPHLTKDQLRGISAIGLAHMGDAVFELLVRSWLCVHGKATGRGLHQATIRLVCAENQAKCAQRILPLLTEAEADVFRRGRNAQVHSVPSHASRAQYGTATALEALLGWLYLQGDTARIHELFLAMLQEEGE